MADIRSIVHDVDAALAFYSQLLGFEEKDRWGSAFAVAMRGDLNLWLSGPGTSAVTPMPDGPQPEPGSWNRLVLTVTDIEAVVERLKKKGVRFRNDILSGPGGKQVLIEDPSGNPLELFEPAH